MSLEQGKRPRSRPTRSVFTDVRKTQELAKQPPEATNKPNRPDGNLAAVKLAVHVRPGHDDAPLQTQPREEPSAVAVCETRMTMNIERPKITFSALLGIASGNTREHTREDDKKLTSWSHLTVPAAIRYFRPSLTAASCYIQDIAANA